MCFIHHFVALEVCVSRILIVDDDASIRGLLTQLLELEGHRCESAASAAEARQKLEHNTFELILLDVMMPGESGMVLLEHVRTHHAESAVMMVTGVDDTNLAKTAIQHGVFGYTIKPFNTTQLVIDVERALHGRELELARLQNLSELRAEVAEGNKAVSEASRLLEQATGALRSFKEEIVLRLARTVELRDEETGKHLQRMSMLSELLAHRMGFSDEECEEVAISSMLHDVGKVAVPDQILLKPGKLTADEFEVVKTHTHIGYELLKGSEAEVLQDGAEVALSHHEWWDGNGYPLGHEGEDIPLTARIAAVADVFDALTSRRHYRGAFLLGDAAEMMKAERGTHFDPDLLDTFMNNLPAAAEIVAHHS